MGQQPIAKAGAAALSILQKPSLREVVEQAAIDELFHHWQPILCMIDPQTLLATVLQAAENRKGGMTATQSRYPTQAFTLTRLAFGHILTVHSTFSGGQ